MRNHLPRSGGAERRRPQRSSEPAPATLPQRALLQLQRTAGNAAATRFVARYEAGEHAQMGSGAPLLDFNGVMVSEGELIALGDFYASSEDMLKADHDELAWLVRLIRQDKMAFEGVPGVQPVTTEEWKAALAGREPGKGYFDLLEDNAAHFEGDNLTEFFVNHRKALKVAHAAAAGPKTVPVEAEALNGWACHYLTDAFSAGHLFDKSQMLDRIREAWSKIDEAWGADTENTFTRGVADAVFANPDAAAKLAAHEAWTPVAWIDITESRFSKILMGLSYSDPDRLFNVILNVVHDRLDESVGDPATAIEVTNKRGNQWTLAGDKSLSQSPETLMFAQQAVAHANRNLEMAARTADESEDEKWIGEVWDYTPQPTPGGAVRMEAMIREMLDIPGAKTIAAFAAKTIENLDSGLEELVKDGTLRKRPAAADPAPAEPGGNYVPSPPGPEYGPARPGMRF